MLDRKSLHRLQDAGLAALLAGVGVAEIWVPFPSVMGEGSPVVTTILVVFTGVVIAFRRRAPLTVVLLLVGTFVVVTQLDVVLILFWGDFVPLMVAVYSVARHGEGRRGLYGLLAGAAMFVYVDLTVELLQSAGEIIFHWTVFILTWSAGRGLRVMEGRAEESMQRAIEVEVASTQQTMAAVVEERTRIARELHDVVAHSVSMIVVQAGAAEQVVDEDPEHVRRALQTIRVTGAGALTEMRRVVAMLREADESGALTPQPGVAVLPNLLEEARAGGLDVSLTVEGKARMLPVGLDLAAYRIVQEALTNVRRHAAATTVSVLLRHGDDDLEIVVRDDGSGVAPGAASNGGHGLIGMRERAAMYGGRLETDAEEGGGFTVRATLPVAPA